MSNEDSVILKILTFEDGTGNKTLDTQLDDTATLLFERVGKSRELSDLEKALQEGIYDEQE